MDPIIWGLREKEKKKEWKLRSVFCYLIDDGRRVLLIKNREKIEQKAKKKLCFSTFVLVSIWMLEDRFQNIHLQGYRPFRSGQNRETNKEHFFEKAFWRLTNSQMEV